MMVPQFMCHIKLITFLYNSSCTDSGNNLLLYVARCTALPYTQFHVQSNPLFQWVISNNFQILPALVAPSWYHVDYSAHGLRSLIARPSEPLIYQGSKSLASQTSCFYSPQQGGVRVTLSMHSNLLLETASWCFPIPLSYLSLPMVQILLSHQLHLGLVIHVEFSPCYYS